MQTSLKKRPDTLREAVRRNIECGEPFFIPMREFYDSFYRAPIEAREAMLAEAPPLTGCLRHDAYAGAVAEHFSLRYGFDVPRWCLDRETRFLKKPWFPCNMENMKALLLGESPISFRRRLIFVDADPCFRPSRNICEPLKAPLMEMRNG